MAKEVKKGTKKATVKAVKKAPTKKVVRTAKPVKQAKEKSSIIPIIYMFLLILGISLVFVSLTLKTANYIDTNLMVTCLGVALVILILSAFVKKMTE